ncbi:MarR family winged helix-turn-helix transcriptional regulator [Granulicella cerasi]|uniref:MarR family winged helix-turn-helix transcriptional regulator n=1 Tax=Granulicella cerasi TaxID=741063 RepID=A0ABW1Z9I7_9BACT|nr:MarR family transcriptional regulator [Granulicella cerasi]
MAGDQENDVQFASALAADLRATIGRLKRRLQEQSGASDLTSSQITVLVRLDKEGPATASALARAEKMRPQSMSAILASLEEAGMVVGSADPHDGRKTLISLTKLCKRWIDVGRAARQDWLTRAVREHLSPAEQKRVAAALPLIKRLAEK